MADYDRLVTAVEARDDHGVPSDRTRRWSHSGQAAVRGHRGRYKLYRLGDLVELNKLAEFDPRARRTH